MAKIGIVTTALNETTLQFAQALSDQRNEVILITTRNQEIPDKCGFQIITPFNKFSTYESIRFLPRLVALQPDILHFVYSDSTELTSAHYILSQFYHILPTKIIACSFFQSPKGLAKIKTQFFLKGCDLITYATHDHLLFSLRKFGMQPGISDVLPPIDYRTENDYTTPSEDLKRLCATLGRFLVVPSDPNDFFQNVESSHLKIALQDHYHLVFLGQREAGPANPNYYVLRNPRVCDIKFLLQKSSGALLAFTELSHNELQKWLRWSLELGTPLFTRPKQNEVLPGLVLDKKTGWILDEGEKSLEKIISDNPTLKLQAYQSKDRHIELTDSTLNEINRLYTKAFQIKSNKNQAP